MLSFEEESITLKGISSAACVCNVETWRDDNAFGTRDPLTWKKMLIIVRVLAFGTISSLPHMIVMNFPRTPIEKRMNVSRFPFGKVW